MECPDETTIRSWTGRWRSRDPLDQARATFLLDRGRATTLVAQAEGQMSELGVRARLELREVMDWQARHIASPPSLPLAQHEATP